ncbi:hypothetical protein H257_00445 [Aphanomyces astaci]|uniref:Uncharacterized protein n=1 Tax=Aphanomyces astaci TaxID=112090 RepID=W4HD65_APHAT|nr:hypothetical protein H257_00445 [Aphanomyces astaci]ETV89048.1 hypothetical protein H257_00445 [Aphanomyces astaci]|eukprot:XP_009821448.1 hypothetical protein H257_00445 [Aphanomyces astaci]
MLPQVLLVLHGTSTARTSVGRRVELYHVTMKCNRVTKEAKIRYNTLRKYLDLLGALENHPDELVVPAKHPFRSSSNQAVVDSRIREFRACFRALSATVLTASQIELVVAMMHEANAFMCRYKMPSQSSQLSSNDSGRIDHVAEHSDQGGTHTPNNNDNEPDETSAATSNVALSRPSQLRPYENAFAALFKARKSNNDQPLARNTNDVSVARTTTSPELSEYLKRLADDMLMELHAATPYRSDTIRLPRPPPSSSHARQSDVDSRLEYTEEDAAYLERIAMGMWANALDANEIVLDHDHDQHDGMDDDENTFQLDRDWERALEAEEAATNRGKTESAEDEVIHNLAQAYFPSYYDNSDDDDDDAFDVTKGKLVTEEMAKPKARSSMSHVLQGYIDDMYYGDDAQVSQATPTSPRPSISLTA